MNETFYIKDLLRILIALVAHSNLELHKMDAKSTFFNCQLYEEVYTFLSKGFDIKGKEYMAYTPKSFYIAFGKPQDKGL